MVFLNVGGDVVCSLQLPVQLLVSERGEPISSCSNDMETANTKLNGCGTFRAIQEMFRFFSST